MVSPRIYDQIQSFHVNKLLATLSDHFSIKVKLRTKCINNLLKKYSKSQYFKSQLLEATKQYKELLKSKQKLYLDKLINELDNMRAATPRDT